MYRLTGILLFMFLAYAEIAEQVVYAALTEADAVSPILDSVTLVNGGYELTGHMPVGSETPAGGFKSILNGSPLTDVSNQLNKTLNNLDTTQEQCFRLEARWTQFNPIQFRGSNEICVQPAIADSPILDEVILQAGEYKLKGHMPANSGTPLGGYKTVLNGNALTDVAPHINRTLSNLDTSTRQCFRLQGRWTQFTPIQFLGSNEICIDPLEARSPILDSVVLADGIYTLTAHMPAESAKPAGGFKSVIDNLPQSDVSDTLSRTISGLDTSETHCFRIEARWTDFSPTRFMGSNEICHDGGAVTATDPILRNNDIVYNSGRYRVTARMPDDSAIPDGGYRLLVNGVARLEVVQQLSWTLNDLDSSIEQCFQIQAYWTQIGPQNTTTSATRCIDAISDSGSIEVFSSGFEAGVSINDKKNDLIGADSSGYDWQHDLESLPYIGGHYLNHVDGVEGINFKFDLVSDPINPDNRVMAMENIEVIGSPASRPQSTLAFNYDENNPDVSIYEFSVAVDIFLGSGFAFSETLSIPIGKDGYWFNMFEIWEHNAGDPNYNRAGRSRVSVYLEKDAGANNPLYFRAANQKMPVVGVENQWSEDNRDVEVPLGRWFTLKAYFNAGGPEDGRFRMSIIDSGVEKTVFDVYDTTQNNDEATAPSGLTAMKNYAAKKLVDSLESHGQNFTIYYDNYRFYEGELK